MEQRKNEMSTTIENFKERYNWLSEFLFEQRKRLENKINDIIEKIR